MRIIMLLCVDVKYTGSFVYYYYYYTVVDARDVFHVVKNRKCLHRSLYAFNWCCVLDQLRVVAISKKTDPVHHPKQLRWNVQSNFFSCYRHVSRLSRGSFQ